MEIFITDFCISLIFYISRIIFVQIKIYFIILNVIIIIIKFY